MALKVSVIKIYEEDLKFLNFLSKASRRPRIHLLSMAVSLLALAVLRPNDIYHLYGEVVREYEEEKANKSRSN